MRNEYPFNKIRVSFLRLFDDLKVLSNTFCLFLFVLLDPFNIPDRVC